MKVNEIIREDVSAEEQLAGGKLGGNLLPVLMFLKKRSEDKELSAKLRTDSLIQLVKNAGDTTFDYNALVDAYESNDSVKEVIKSFNREEIILKSDVDTDDDLSSDHEGEDGSGDGQKSQDPEKVVSQMAKRAAKK